MMGVLGSEANGEWVMEQLKAYEGRHFIVDGKEDLTTNVKFISERMVARGFIANGEEQDFLDLHIFPIEFFCPRMTTGEYLRTQNTYCESRGDSSWALKSIKGKILRMRSPKTRIKLIKLKRNIIG